MELGVPSQILWELGSRASCGESLLAKRRETLNPKP